MRLTGPALVEDERFPEGHAVARALVGQLAQLLGQGVVAIPLRRGRGGEPEFADHFGHAAVGVDVIAAFGHAQGHVQEPGLARRLLVVLGGVAEHRHVAEQLRRGRVEWRVGRGEAQQQAAAGDVEPFAHRLEVAQPLVGRGQGEPAVGRVGQGPVQAGGEVLRGDDPGAVEDLFAAMRARIGRGEAAARRAQQLAQLHPVPFVFGARAFQLLPGADRGFGPRVLLDGGGHHAAPS